MALPRWLDRLWLWLIVISFLVIVPGFVLMWAERVGWGIVGLFIAATFLTGVYRGLPGAGR